MIKVNIGADVWKLKYSDEATLRKDTTLHEVLHSFYIDDGEKHQGTYIFDIMAYGYASTGKIKCHRVSPVNGQIEDKELTFDTSQHPVISHLHVRTIQETPIPR